MKFRKILLGLSRIIPDKLFINIKFYKNFGKFVDFDNPQTYSEKLQWIKLYNRDPFYNLVVDKDHSYTTSNFVVGNCGKSGDIFKFIMDIEGVEFKEALEILAKKAGVELKKESPQKRTERQRQYEICEIATKFFPFLS